MKTIDLIDEQVLAGYYASLPREYGYQSQCKMVLLGNLRDKRVLDIDCRRGKGVIKLSDYVGQNGTAIGVDPSPEWIEIALSYMEESWRKNGYVRNNMDYRVGYPENLAVAGLTDGEFDMVYANSSLNLAYNIDAAFSEMFRVLRPGGVLVFDGVVAEGERDAGVVESARALGNAIQSALSRDAFARLAHDTGFYAPEYHDEGAVLPDVGFKAGEVVPIVEPHDGVVFTRTTARLAKPKRNG